ERQEVVEVPEQRDGHRQLVQLLERLVLEALRVQAIFAGGLEHVVRLAAVARDAALVPQFFERHPAAVVGENVGQRRGAAFDRLHLEDRRRLDAFVRRTGYRLLDGGGDSGFGHVGTLGCSYFWL